MCEKSTEPKVYKLRLASMHAPYHIGNPPPSTSSLGYLRFYRLIAL